MSGHLYDEENNKAVFDLTFENMVSETETIDFSSEKVEDSNTYTLQLQLENSSTRERINIGDPVEIKLK